MKACREYRRVINRVRSKEAQRGRRNGGVGWLDSFRLEQLVFNSKRRYQRNGGGIGPY